MVHYIAHNEIMKYWLIHINSTLSEEDCCNGIFRGKTLNGALKAAKRYCDNSNKRILYKTLSVGEVLYECDPWGRKVTR